MNSQKLTIQIKGLHCRSCEILLEDVLTQVAGVEKVKVNWRAGTAEIFYAGQAPSEKEIIKVIREAGYEVGPKESASFFSQNWQDYKDLFLAMVFLVGGYFILKGLNLPGFNFPSFSSGLSLPIVLMIGLTAGFSTCLALVGGLVLGASAKYAKENPEATTKEKFRVHILFNLGRVAGYMFFGALLGALGSVLQLSPFFTGILTVLVGVVMLIMGLQLTNVLPGLNQLRFTLPKSFSRVLGIKNAAGRYSDSKTLLLGALTFFLPCGFTQAMQLYAVSSGNFASGALIMGLFALGTMPGLLSLGGLVSVFKKTSANKFFKFAGVVVVALALFNISNGFSLTGWSDGVLAWASPVKATAPTNNQPKLDDIVIENGQQIIKMTETNSGYSPNQFTIKKGVPVRWVIDAQAPYSCASSLVMPKFNIRKNLQAGENIIEFTPGEIGRVDFSCSMGMYRGAFNVVDENGAGAPTADSINDQNSTPSSSTSCGCGSCGAGAKTCNHN